MHSGRILIGIAITPALRYVPCYQMAVAMLTLTDEMDSGSRSWTQWQKAVVQLLRAYFNEALQRSVFDEVDWVSWRIFCNEGRTPKGAIDRALERDF